MTSHLNINNFFYSLILIIGLIVADYVTKLWIVQHLDYGTGFVVFEYLNIVRVHNTGAAFGFLNGYGGWQLWVLTGLAITVASVMIFWICFKPLKRFELLAFVLISAGALGNALDRMLYGYVVDFIDFYYHSWHYPAFNVADIAISCGAILLIFDIFFGKNKPQK